MPVDPGTLQSRIFRVRSIYPDLEANMATPGRQGQSPVTWTQLALDEGEEPRPLVRPVNEPARVTRRMIEAGLARN